MAVALALRTSPPRVACALLIEASAERRPELTDSTLEAAKAAHCLPGLTHGRDPVGDARRPCGERACGKPAGDCKSCVSGIRHPNHHLLSFWILVLVCLIGGVG